MPVQVLAQQGSSKTWHTPESCLSTSKADADTLLVEELFPPSHLQEVHPERATSSKVTLPAPQNAGV